MSKRKLIIGALAVLLLLAVGLAFFGWRSGWIEFGDPVFTEEIPEKRPKRLDHKQLERFSSQPIDEILLTVMTEAATMTPAPLPAATTAPSILGMLPDAPLPFPEGVEPIDEDGLKKFVTGMQQDKEGEPSTSERWQFNLALAAIGVDPAKIPEAIRLDTHPVPESETFPVRLVARDAEISGPFALGDFRGEIGLGIVHNGGAGLAKLIAEGGTEALDSFEGTVPGNGVYPADFDADGDLDLFITRGGGLPNSLLRCEGGKFEDVTIALGLLSFNDTTTAAWLDFDGDGLLDLLVGSADHPFELYHQTTGGIFQPVAWDLKLWVPRGVHTIETTDFSGDGFPDLFLGIDGLPDRLCLAKPSAVWSDWRFDDTAADAGISSDSGSTAAAFFDFDNDGRPDLLLAYAVPVSVVPAGPVDPGKEVTSTVRLFRNEGENRFANITDLAGARIDEAISTVEVGDLDNDGYEDILLGTAALSINRIFWNRGGVAVKEISIVSQGGYLDEATAYAVGDLEKNGTLDVLYLNAAGRVRWLEATGAMDGWVQVTVKGHLPGALLSLTVRDGDWVLHQIKRRMDTNGSLLIGIGEAEVIERIELFAPEGGEALAALDKIEPNREVVIELPKRPKKRAVVPMESDSSDLKSE